MPPTHGTSPSRSVTLTIKAVSFGDTRTFTSVFIRSFRHDDMSYWLLRYSPLGTLERQKQEDWAISYRTPSMARWQLDPRHQLFLAYDADDPNAAEDPIAMSGWIAPSTLDARHHLRRVTLMERSLRICYKIYDTIANLLMPPWLYEALHPEMVGFLNRRRRWTEIMATNDREVIKHEHKVEGFWMLAFLGVVEEYERRGIASQLLVWGLDKADEEDRVVYLASSPPGVRLYMRHGFEVVHDEPCFEGEPHGGFHNVVMCRRRKSERQAP